MAINSGILEYLRIQDWDPEIQSTRHKRSAVRKTINGGDARNELAFSSTVRNVSAAAVSTLPVTPRAAFTVEIVFLLFKRAIKY